MHRVHKLRVSIALSMAALAAAIAVSPIVPAGEAPPPVLKGVYVCRSYSDAKRMYVSDVFTANAEQQAVYNAYRRFLRTKYHVEDQFWCGGANQGPMTEAQARELQKKNWATFRTQGYTVVETGWKFTASEAHFAHLCIAYATRLQNNRDKRVYARATEFIEAPASAEPELDNAWRAHLKQLHPELRDETPACTRWVDEDAAARQKRLKDNDQEVAGYANGPELLLVPFSFTPSGKAAEVPEQAAGGGH